MKEYSISAKVDSAVVQLSPLDLYYNKFACIPWVMFYDYDVSFSKLEEALQKISLEYPVLCGRLASNSTTRMHVEVKKGAGFRFTDVKSEMTLLEAISESRVFNQIAEFPSYPALPRSFESMNLFEVIDQDTPVFGVKLVHYKDGTCSLAVTVHHTIRDAQRLANLMVDIARAYRGESLQNMDHDRSRLWPDSFLKSIDLGLSPQDFPRECKIKDDKPVAQSFPGESYSIETIYFPQADIDSLKQKVMLNLTEDMDYVSQVDIISALSWMLRCELSVIKNGFNGVIRTAEDLEIFESNHLFFTELLSNNTTLLPDNYFGNGFLYLSIQYPKQKEAIDRDQDLFNTLAEACIVIRKKILEDRCSEKQALNVIAAYKLLNEAVELPYCISVISSLAKMPFSNMGFGEGSPIYYYTPGLYPFHLTSCICCSDGVKGGMFLHFTLLETEKQSIMHSSVMKVLFPSAKFISQMTLDELAKVLYVESDELSQ